MASIKRLFNAITIIRPEKIGSLGIEGLEQELDTNLKMLVEEVWASLPFSKEGRPLPFDEFSIPILPQYCSEDILSTYLEDLNQSIKKSSLLFTAIQERTQIRNTKLKSATRMPAGMKDVEIDGLRGTVADGIDWKTGENIIDKACSAMGIPSSPENLQQWGEMLFQSYLTATQRFEDFLISTASILMTEDEIKELIDYNELTGVYLPNVYNDDVKLVKLCAELINQKYLNDASSKDDFVFFFSGKGNTPNQTLLWQGSTVELGVFLDCYFIKASYEIPNKWKISQKIFGRKSLRQSLNNAKNSTSEKLMNKRYQLFDDILESV